MELSRTFRGELCWTFQWPLFIPFGGLPATLLSSSLLIPFSSPFRYEPVWAGYAGSHDWARNAEISHLNVRRGELNLGRHWYRLRKVMWVMWGIAQALSHDCSHEISLPLKIPLLRKPIKAEAHVHTSVYSLEETPRGQWRNFLWLISLSVSLSKILIVTSQWLLGDL